MERRRERSEGHPLHKPLVSSRRRQLELARVDLLHRIEVAPDRLKESLRQALAALDAQLQGPEPE